MKQAGSAVRPDKLRFDFTHEQQLTPEQRKHVERLVNQKVFEAIAVRTYVTPIEEARKLGAMMLFGEKYGDEVRVVEIGDYSAELCGGTHVRSTAEIGPFLILSEGSVGSGARRIEAVTAGEAWTVLEGRSKELEDVRVELEQVKREAKKPKQAETGPNILWQDKQGKVFVAEVEGARGSALRDLSDQLRQREGADAVVLASTDDGKVALVVNLDKSLAGLDAVAIVRELGPLIGGGGGGRPTLAEAGGKNVDGVRDALTTGRDRLTARSRVKVLALDYGSARTGVAVSDPTGIVARPVTTVDRAGSDTGFAKLLAVIEAEEPELVVVGMPLTLRGEHGEQARETADFVERLRGALARPVETYDERFTSVLAGGDDARAAAHLLSSYLEWQSARS